VTNTRSLLSKLADRIIETQEAGLILPRHKNMLLSALNDGSLDFRVPSRVTARTVSRLDNEYGFDIFRCSQCGRLYDFRTATELRLRCNRCRGRPRLSQAPVFVANFRDRPPTPIPFSEAMQKVTFDWNARYCVYTSRELRHSQSLPREFLRNPLKGLREADPSRPIYSLCWTCPIPHVPCDWRDNENYCTYSRYQNPRFKRWRPDLWRGSRRVRLIQRPVRTRAAFGTYVDRYRPITISEGSTKPIRVAVHGFSSEDTKQLEFNEKELTGISEIFFVKKLEIFQFTIALAIGLPYVPIRRRAIRLLSDIGPDGGERLYTLTRRLVTEGIIIKLREEAREQIVNDWMQRRSDVSVHRLAVTLYHTVSHAFLKPLPMIAGLNASAFHASFSPTDNEVAVYDNSPGGIGGVRTLLDEGSQGIRLRADYIVQLLGSGDCQLECSWACKACLHTGSCGWLNRQLQRRMMEGIVNEQLRDKYLSA